MFDYHLHSSVSYDAKATAAEIVEAARRAGLKDICFTDHTDYAHSTPHDQIAYKVADYNRAYDGLSDPEIAIHFGVEMGLTPWNQAEIAADLKARHYDFVIGSVHFVNDYDIYLAPWWEGRTAFDAERAYFLEMLECVKAHDDFDVLGHLTYVAKPPVSPLSRIIPLADHREIIDEILKVLVSKGKGMEVNTSGIDRFGDFLPGAEYLRRFKELGGRIVTVGSDAHNPQRVGQYTDRACAMLKEIFGYVCTFQNRQPVFHKL